jgi:phosphoglycolate phosphatase-like HAD superfamily hydrolase
VALENGNTSDALVVIDDLVRVKTENYIAEGEKKKEAEKKAKASVRSSLTSYWKPLYLAAYQSKDSEEMKRIRKLLKETKLYDNVVETCQDWVKNSKK